MPLPDLLKAGLSKHLQRIHLADDETLVFTSPLGTPMRCSNFYRRAWMSAVAKVGLPGIHFHDYGMPGTLLLLTRARALANLMDCMGHSSTRVALIYLHSSDERQRVLAAAVGQAARAALGRTATASGTKVARSPGQVP